MRKKRIAQGAGALVAGLLAVAGGLYIQASRVPAGYHPASLTAPQREQAAKEFVNHVLVEFSNDAQRNRAFQWSVTQEELNDYLASMDEIASSCQGVRSGDVSRWLDSVGLSDPAVVLGGGVMTLLVRSKDYGKVLSVDLSFAFTPGGKMVVRLVRTRVGRLTIPQSLVRGQLDRLKAKLRQVQARARARTARRRGGVSTEDVGSLLAVVIAAIDAEPISPQFVGGINHKRVRVVGIEIVPGLLTLHVTPVRRQPAPHEPSRAQPPAL